MASVLALLALLTATACGADPKSVDGALSAAASAVASHDHAALLAVIDERSRHALASIYRARQRAATVVRSAYPPEARASALRELGDAVEATSEVDLFARRCDDACVQGLAATLGAPKEVHTEGPLTLVRTVRGTEVRLYRGSDGRHGLVWQTEALARERTRAAAELDLIQKNGAQYGAERALRQDR